jgi:Ran GTPase-activating protein (RanGAP) involved in mRNA processing and transport
VIDICDTNIGNYGAMCVGAVLSLCDQLEEIRLNGCAIEDEGAMNLFGELMTSEKVMTLELSNNPITEKCFPKLVELLEANKKIQRIELEGIKVQKEVAMKLLSPYI